MCFVCSRPLDSCPPVALSSSDCGSRTDDSSWVTNVVPQHTTPSQESTKHYFAAHIIFNDTAVQPTEVFANKAAKADGNRYTPCTVIHVFRLGVKRLTVVFNKALPPASPAGADEPVAPKSLMAAPSIMPSAMGAPSQAAPPPPAAAPAAAPPPAAAPAK